MSLDQQRGRNFIGPLCRDRNGFSTGMTGGIPSSGYTETMKRKLLRCTASRWHLLHVTSGVARFNYVKLIYQALLNNNTACINEGNV